MEEEGDKPDPNNIYFVDKIVGSVASQVHPQRRGRLPRRDKEGHKVRVTLR
jgi:hypothetical protein